MSDEQKGAEETAAPEKKAVKSASKKGAEKAPKADAKKATKAKPAAKAKKTSAKKASKPAASATKGAKKASKPSAKKASAVKAKKGKPSAKKSTKGEPKKRSRKVMSAALPWKDVPAAVRPLIEKAVKADSAMKEGTETLKRLLPKIQKGLGTSSFVHPDLGAMSIMIRGDKIFWRVKPTGVAA